MSEFVSVEDLVAFGEQNKGVHEKTNGRKRSI
jgi:hypothetical protein